MKTYLEPKDITLLENATSNLRDKLLVRILFRLGCRISEALALEVEDIDFIQSTVIIVHLKRRAKLSCPNCGAGIALSHSYCPKCGVRINGTF
jgi:integrase/recombinase XerD